MSKFCRLHTSTTPEAGWGKQAQAADDRDLRGWRLPKKGGGGVAVEHEQQAEPRRE